MPTVLLQAPLISPTSLLLKLIPHERLHEHLRAIAVTGLFLKLSEKAGLRLIRLHDLRHIHATELLRLGEPLHVVAKRLGHRDAMVTATIYAHVSDQQAETASSRFAAAVSGIS